jgi:transcriptional regulator with XRE-family HTH domain
MAVHQESYMPRASERSGALIRKAREEKGWSQSFVGQKLGITGAAIGHYETMHSKPSEERARKLSTLLGVPVELLDTSGRADRGTSKNARVLTVSKSKKSIRTGRRFSKSAQGMVLHDEQEIAIIAALRSLPKPRRSVVMEFISAGVGSPAGLKSASAPLTKARRGKVTGSRRA